jgi:hypothetical protein
MYVKVNNQGVEKFPYTIGNLRKDNPNVSFPKVLSNEVLQNFGVFEVAPTEKPSFNEATQKVEQGDPVNVNGQWQQVWVIKSLSEEEMANALAYKISQARAKRNDLLARSDWTQVADAPVDQQAWATYRQALRDIPSQVGFPDVDFPLEPGAVVLSGNAD